MDSETRNALERLMELQRSVEARTGHSGTSAHDVLQVGQEVLEFAHREESAVFPVLRLLDPAARAELGAEHQQLADDLELLRWLVETTPDSPDVPVLAEAIARRMRVHVARDGRLLAQAARLAGQ